jgi:hypothetical protein
MSKLTRLLACLLDCLLACLIACLLDCLLACLLDCLLVSNLFLFSFFFFFFFLANNLHPTLSLLPNSYFGCVHFILFLKKNYQGGFICLKVLFLKVQNFLVQSVDFFFLIFFGGPLMG